MHLTAVIGLNILQTIEESIYGNEIGTYLVGQCHRLNTCLKVVLINVKSVFCTYLSVRVLNCVQ